jgi:hypothetical protein
MSTQDPYKRVFGIDVNTTADHIGERDGMMPKLGDWWWCQFDDWPVQVVEIGEMANGLTAKFMNGCRQPLDESTHRFKWLGPVPKPGQATDGIPGSFTRGMADVASMRVVPLDTALTNPPPGQESESVKACKICKGTGLIVSCSNDGQFEDEFVCQFCKPPTPQPEAGKAIEALREINDHCMSERLSSRRRDSHSLAKEIKAICDRALGEKGQQ